jgi:DNA end-binding protein Ku
VRRNREVHATIEESVAHTIPLMRTSWNGSLSFGLVSIPVGLAPATKPAARQSDVSFRLLHRECATPIKQKRWCPTHDREVTQDEIVRGYEFAKGQFVIVEDAELEALERVDDSRSIEIRRFVPTGSVDPIFFDRHYYLVPAPGAAQRRPYVLLLEAMRDTETAAIGRFIRSGRESLCLVRAKDDSLALETMFVAEDVYSSAEISEAVEETSVKKPELELAKQVIESLLGDFDAAELRSDYRRDLKTLLEAKAGGQEISIPEPDEEAEVPVVDLMAALKASVAAARKGDDAEKKPASRSKSKARAKAS